MKLKIALIEPDRRSYRLIASLLHDNYELIYAKKISAGYPLITTCNPDIIIIDPQYPEKDGIDLIKAIRKWSDCPIIALSSNGSGHAAVNILSAGADDFLRKPFFSEEFLARIATCARHISLIESAKGMSKTPCYLSGDMRLEFDSRSLFIKGNRIHLTKNEFRILELLCKYSGKVLTYDFILKSIWGPKSGSNTGILRVNITNLRKKIETDPLKPKYIFTENGVGYRVNENTAD